MFSDELLSRRHFLWNSAGGIGALALASLLKREARGNSPTLPAFSARAKRVVQIFCAGGVSHIDTFDYKPDLQKFHGKALEGKGENKGFFGQPGKVMKSPFEFRQHGQSGHWVSSLFPHLAQCVDEVSFIHSMVARSNNHTPATFQANSGFTMNGFPCMGSWISYGLGTENEDLPTFVVLPDSRGFPAGGSINWTNGFLPARHQGVAFRTQSAEPVTDLKTPAGIAPEERARDMRLLEAMNRSFADAHPGEGDFAARLRSYELAARMQLSIPEATDLSGEPPHIRELYGLGIRGAGTLGETAFSPGDYWNVVCAAFSFSMGARSAVRVSIGMDTRTCRNHSVQAATMDRPTAALIKDLKQRGMLEDTLVIWNTEFGRGPATQGIDSPGRDHHPDAFTCFLAGAGVKAGFSYGKSDEVGYFAPENPVTIYDLHATILHLLGVDHEKLTFYHNGINRRLTDVHGKVVTGLLT